MLKKKTVLENETHSFIFNNHNSLWTKSKQIHSKNIINAL